MDSIMTFALVAAITLCFEVAPRLDGEPFGKEDNGKWSTVPSYCLVPLLVT